MLVCNYDLPQANALKVLLIAVTTLVPIAMFASADDIFWTAGAFMSAGSLLGGHVGGQALGVTRARRMGILAPRRGDSAGACPTCLALHRAATSRPLRCREKVHGGVAHWCFCNPHIRVISVRSRLRRLLSQSLSNRPRSHASRPRCCNAPPNHHSSRPLGSGAVAIQCVNESSGGRCRPAGLRHKGGAAGPRAIAIEGISKLQGRIARCSSPPRGSPGSPLPESRPSRVGSFLQLGHGLR